MKFKNCFIFSLLTMFSLSSSAATNTPNEEKDFSEEPKIYSALIDSFCFDDNQYNLDICLSVIEQSKFNNAKANYTVIEMMDNGKIKTNEKVYYFLLKRNSYLPENNEIDKKYIKLSKDKLKKIENNETN